MMLIEGPLNFPARKCESCSIVVSESDLLAGALDVGEAFRVLDPENVFSSGIDGARSASVEIQASGIGSFFPARTTRRSRIGRVDSLFRNRRWLREFFREHEVQAGDSVILDRAPHGVFQLAPCRPAPSFTTAEYFAGIGLVRIAMESSGFQTIFAHDIDSKKLQMYVENFGESGVVLGDIHDLPSDHVPDCDVATASFPCNDVSIAGGMAGLAGKNSSAFWGLIRVLQEKDRSGKLPGIVLLENVPGFMVCNGGRDLQSALESLNQLGYACDLLLVDAARFVPQSRSRLFVLAVHGAMGEYPFGLQPTSARPSSVVAFMLGHPNLAWRVHDVPPLPDRRRRLASLIENVADDDPLWWNEKRTQHFLAQLSPRHARIADEMASGLRTRVATAFRRVRNGRSMAELRTDGIAGCLRTPRGGSGRQILFQAGKGSKKVRLVSARECARLQGVPEGYRITVPLNQALFGFGDAVCVPVVAWIARHGIRPALEELRGAGKQSEARTMSHQAEAPPVAI